MGTNERTLVRPLHQPQADATIASLLRQAATLAPQQRAALRVLLGELNDRCWSCNRTGAEAIRVQRRSSGGRWTNVATTHLCAACLTALESPILARQLGLSGRGRAEVASEAPAGWVELPPAGQDEAAQRPAGHQDGAAGEPLELLKGA